jgi:predicted ATPase
MLIHKLTLQELLSFDNAQIELRPLNILVGPNGSGKSNLIACIDLLRSSATDFLTPMRGTGGGIGEWKRKGALQLSHIIAHITDFDTDLLRHDIIFSLANSRFDLLDELIRDEFQDDVSREEKTYYHSSLGNGTILTQGIHVDLKQQHIRHNEPILAQRDDPTYYPVLAYLNSAYKKIKIYREWSFGSSSVFRKPQPADMPTDYLEEDFSNLGLFLNHLRSIPSVKKTIISHLKDLYSDLDDFDVRVKGGTVEVFLTEGKFVFPASRLSDGTLRYLCLLAILCDPEPPPLICIEEPELGLHPDLLHKVADLLIEASERTQLIVSTHSDLLVDAMTETPESVVVFEKHDGQTKMSRLDANRLKHWLTQYRLGELWMSGEIGGKRW